MLADPPNAVRAARVSSRLFAASLVLWTVVQASALAQRTPLGAFDGAAAEWLQDASAEEKLSSQDDNAQVDGARALTREIQAEWPDDARRSFLIAITPHALHAATEHCVPPSVTVAQAILESGWGRSELAREHHNLFGVKAWTADAPTLRTVEYADGHPRPQTARFRVYEDWGQSIERHGALLASDPRYAKSMARWDSWPVFVRTLAPVYASDPGYEHKIASLVTSYRLDEWDALVRRVAARRDTCGGSQTAGPGLD